MAESPSSIGAARERYDVAILGGGLAGLTLALQLRAARPDTSIIVFEKRVGPAREAAFKVGESTVELSAQYFANVVGMKDHMEAAQNPKAGLRFFFPADGNEDISRRVEWGSPRWPPVPAYHLDRGRFENELGERVAAAGVDLLGGSRVQEVALGRGGDDHRVTILRDGSAGAVGARWVIDAAGRACLLKKQLDLAEPNGHHINSAWFRLAGGVDIEDWARDNEAWLGRMHESGMRRFSTNHLMDQGYWVWLIPLASGPISIGVVADPRFHPWERMNTLDAMIDWMQEHEPQLAEVVDGRREAVEDFLRVEDFSYGCKRCFSADRWCVTGEAGAFLDPLYSPGSDFIALSNTFITDIVKRELGGEDVRDRIEAHNTQYLELFDTILHDYRDQYQLFGDAQVMCVKLHWDYAFYWAYPALWFFQDKWVDLDFLADTRPELERAIRLTKRMQGFFREWHEAGGREFRDSFVTLFPYLLRISDELSHEFEEDALREKSRADLQFLEAFAVAIFAKAAQLLPDTKIERRQPINPYAISLDKERWERDGLFDGTGPSQRESRQLTKGLQFAWLDEFGGDS